MHPPPPAELSPSDLVTAVDDTVEWEVWDSAKYAEAWASLTKEAADGGGNTGLTRAVEALLGKGWRPLHAAAQHGQLQQLDVLLVTSLIQLAALNRGYDPAPSALV